MFEHEHLKRIERKIQEIENNQFAMNAKLDKILQLLSPTPQPATTLLLSLGTPIKN